MNWFSILAMVSEVMKAAPHLADDVKQLIDKLHDHDPAPPHVSEAIGNELDTAGTAAG